MQTITVRLTPRASADRIGDIRSLPDGGEQLLIYVTATAEDGKANNAMLRLLAKHFGVAASRLTIMRGVKSRNKQVRVE